MARGVPDQSMEALFRRASSFGPHESIDVDLVPSHPTYFTVRFGEGKQVTPYVVVLLKLLPSTRFDHGLAVHMAHLDDFDRFRQILDAVQADVAHLTDAFRRRTMTERLGKALERRAADRERIMTLHTMQDSDVEVPGLVNVDLYPFQRVNVEFLETVERALLADDMGLGKAFFNGTPILTPGGWRPIGALVPGDLVIGSDGQPTPVTGVYPQGVKDVYECRFTDGTAVRCCDEHLWAVSDAPGGTPRILPLAAIAAQLSEDRQHAHRWLPMLAAPVQFADRAWPEPADPWTVGALLADPGADLSARRGGDLSAAAKMIDQVAGVRSDPKGRRLPHAALWTGAERRLAILRGLFDVAGTVTRGGWTGREAVLHSASCRLLDDVAHVARSLGGVACVEPLPDREGDLCWTVRIRMPRALPPFSGPGAPAGWTGATDRPRKGFETVRSAGREECVCISVEAEDSLYVVDGFTLTHNTLSVLSLLSRLRKQGKVRRALAVTTASTKYGWAREARRFFNMETVVVDGSRKPVVECPLTDEWTYQPNTPTCRKCGRKAKCKSMANRRPEDVRLEQYGQRAPLVITNYELLMRDVEKVAAIKPPFDFIVADEVHKIRNSQTKQNRAMVLVGEQARYRIGVTGTPVQNAVGDIWSIMQFIDPRLFGGKTAFFGRYTHPDAYGGAVARNLDDLHLRLKTVMIRHRKEEVAKDLPKKRYLRRDVDLTKEQRAYYEKAKLQMLTEGDQEVRDRVNEAEVLAQIAYLRQICDSTELIDATVKPMSAKADLLDDLLDEEVMPATDKVVIYCTFRRMIDILRKRLSRYPSVEITGKVFGTQRIPAAEASALGVPGEPVGRGEVSVDRRILAQQRFVRDPEVRIMFLSDAGGEGLNLQAAHTIILFDMPFNPQKIAQVEDRIHRIGQVEDCDIFTLIARDTIEDRILEVLDEKRDLFDQVVEGSGMSQVLLRRWRQLI